MKPWVYVLAMALTLGHVRAARAAQFVYASTDAGTIYQYHVGPTGRSGR